MASRIVTCVVRPLPVAKRQKYSALLGDARRLPTGLVDTAELSPGLSIPSQRITSSRRVFLRAVPVIATASALPLSVAATGCDPNTVQALLSAIELAKELFTIVEEITGLFVANNPGGTDVNLEVETNLRNGQDYGQIVDSMSCVAKLPANSGLMEIAWCAGFLAKELGSHLVDAQEGGNAPVKSNPFDVVTG